MHTPAREAVSITGETPQDAILVALSTSDLRDEVIEWARKDKLCVAEGDYHDLYQPRPELTEIRAAELQPRPFAYHLSHGMGCKLFYAAADGYTAEELAAVGAIAWREKDPRAKVETLRNTRNPKSPSTKHGGALGGPVYVQTPNTDVSGFTLIFRPRREANPEKWGAWLETRGWHIGQRIAHEECLIDPGPSSSVNPVQVGEKGLMCYRCLGKGLTFGRMPTPGLTPSTALVPDDTARAPAPASDSPLLRMMQQGSRWEVTAPHLRKRFPGIPDSILKPAYSAAVFSCAREAGADVEAARKKADRAMLPVNTIANFLERPKATAKCDPADRKTDVVRFSNPAKNNTVTIEGCKNGAVVFCDRANPTSEKRRRAIADALGVTPHQLLQMWNELGAADEHTFQVADLPADPTGTAPHEFEIVGRNVNDIAADIVAAVGSTLNSFPSGLFAVEDGHVVAISTAKALHAYVARVVRNAQYPIVWRDGTGLPVWDDMPGAVRALVPKYHGYFPRPRYPMPSDMFCVESVPLPAAQRQCPHYDVLDRFIGEFNPAAAVDRVLLKAAFVTLSWGGPPGKRPVFLFTAPEDDAEGGRGVGKSTAAECNAAHAGGALSFTQDSTVSDLRTRILSPEGTGKWVIILDNIKSDQLSNGDFEGLITAEEHSGRQLYAGEGRVRNYHTIFLTMNGGSLSKDFAQRVVPIRLARPSTRDLRWGDNVNEYRTNPDYHAELWASAIDVIRRAETLDWASAPGLSRWSLWETKILAGCCADRAEFEAVLRELGERRDAADSDDVNAEALAEAFRTYLATQRAVPRDELESAVIELTVEEVAMIADGALYRTGRRKPAAALAEVGRYAGKIPQIVRGRTNTARVYFWVGGDLPDASGLRARKKATELRDLVGQSRAAKSGKHGRQSGDRRDGSVTGATTYPVTGSKA
ncbi:hypothetical protein [Gemmata sp. SH-PL17]|uniref:hypothetical protein n=1 Tax=Gemmata sp. SH-PL17 TaxID=1630693 RepID=UPI0009ED8B27|nr:hypothetical protein [Gemmata sp. SH-PL17]